MTQFEMGSLMGLIDDEYILEAARTCRLAPRSAVNARHAPARVKRASYKKIVRIALIAAAAAVLLTSAAYAADLFGLRERIISRSGPADGRSYLSLAGIAGSPEYEASAEWIVWHTQYEAAQSPGWIDDNWMPDDPVLRQYAVFYPCYNYEMLDKLLEISESHGLKLHTFMSASTGMNDFYAKAGTAAFTRGDNEPAGGYIYEDGSFRLDGASTLCEDGMYTLVRNISGTLPPMESSVWELDGYAESVYRTALGADVVIAASGELPMTYIFYHHDNAFLQLSARVTDAEAAKALADTFDFAAACAGEAKVTEMVSAAPREAEGANAVTLEDFAASPEYKGLREFVAALRSRGVGSYGDVFPVPELYDDLQWLNDTATEICAAYSLRTHSSMRQLFDYDECRQAAGVGDFVLDPDDAESFRAMTLYEDGSFNMNNGFFYYIRKGALCTDSQYVASWLDLPQYETSWQYETASGAVVCCATGGGEASMVLYETPEAWVVISGGERNLPAYALEALADRYDLAQLP